MIDVPYCGTVPHGIGPRPNTIEINSFSFGVSNPGSLAGRGLQGAQGGALLH